MSYILDALKKADAEREQGGVPGLHSRPQAPAPGDDDDEPRARTLPIVWVGAGVALSLIAVLSWQLLRRDAAVPPVQTAQADSTAPMQGMPASPQGAQPAQPPHAAAADDAAAALPPPATPAMAPPPQPTPAAAPLAAPPTPQAAPQAYQPPQPQPALQPAAVAPSPPPAPAAAVAQPPAVPPAAPPAVTVTPAATGRPLANTSAQRLPQLSELPDDVRREIPQLTIGGAMYSEIPAQRMLIVNSQVFREGEQPYQGLVLEEIRLKSAVFRYRSHRYTVNY